MKQERIFRDLPDHLAHMALFAVNTGLRDSNLCGLRWAWEVPVAQLGRSVFVIPREVFKSRRPHVMILNDAARGGEDRAAEVTSTPAPIGRKPGFIRAGLQRFDAGSY